MKGLDKLLYHLKQAGEDQEDDNRHYRILDSVKIMRALRESLIWIVPKVHQAHHDGGLDVCTKSTCKEYHSVLKKCNEIADNLEGK